MIGLAPADFLAMVLYNLLQGWLTGLIPWVIALFILAFLDGLSGAALGWKKGVFSIEKLPEFLETFALYLLAWLLAEILAFLVVALQIEIPAYVDALKDYGPKVVYSWFAVFKYVTSILKHIDEIRNLPNPDLSDESTPGSGIAGYGP